jgi:ATP-dependent DNA helicase RecQ
MIDLFEEFQELILANSSSDLIYNEFRQKLRIFQEEMDNKARARSQSLFRLSHAVQYLHSDREDRATGTSDLAVLIRQVIRSHHRSLRIPTSEWLVIRNRAWEANLYLSKETPDFVTIHASPWHASWLPFTQAKDIDELAQRREFSPVIGDGLIFSMTEKRFPTYKSLAQKRAVDAVLYAAAGSTTIISLPTGAGKSMCITLPAWQASRGGIARGGTTIVIVPTVSLAIDQYRHVNEYFGTAMGPSYKPQSFTNDTPADVRAAIYTGIQEGTLPILYTSPEALLNNPILYSKVLTAASRGTLNWFVIDEAHIVDTWGADFRTEFQFLSTYRRRLLDLSGKRLRTLLLSATISNECLQTLLDLFAEQHNHDIVLANMLRPEVSYWFDFASDKEIRQKHVLEALYNLPRPAILYVTQPQQAQEWLEILKSVGFNRIAAFSGATNYTERRAIMQEWIRNERDLIIATSAFGLGVNKEDVRTIIHAALPENMDRFYQEVGRGGRDGLSSISLTCVAEEDFRLAKQMIIRSRITPEKAWLRWKAMWEQSEPYKDLGDKRIIDLDTVPSYNPEMSKNETHRNWNEHVLLLMQRAGLIQIVDIAPKPIEKRELGENLYRKWILVYVLMPDIANDEESFRKAFDPHRREELDDIEESLRKIWWLVRSYASVQDVKPYTNCLANELADLYPDTVISCGGCPFCRKNKIEPYSLPVVIEESVGNSLVSDGTLHPRVEAYIDPYPSLNAILDSTQPYEENTIQLLSTLVSVGFEQLVIPKEFSFDENRVNALIMQLAEKVIRPHRILLDEWLIGNKGGKLPLYGLHTTVLYPRDETRADAIYRATKTYIKNNKIVHIVSPNLYLLSEHGRFTDRVNGLQQSVSSLLKKIIELRDMLS